MGENRESVVITGVGPITSIGIGKHDYWTGLMEGRVGTTDMDDSLDRRLRSRVGAPVSGFHPANYGLEDRQVRLLDPVSVYALAATSLALEDAGFTVKSGNRRKQCLEILGVDANRVGVIIGTGIGGLSTTESSHARWTRSQPLIGATRYALPMLIPNAVPAQVAIRYGLHGECKAVSTACAAGTMAIGDAYRLIRDGELDMAIAGGSEKTLEDYDGFSMIGFDLLHTLSTRNDDPKRASRPFDTDRDGFVMSEGAGLLILEKRSHAEARGARIYAEISSYASTCDAHSMLALETSGEQMARVMRLAIERADEVISRDIVYANTHGTSTRLNDPTEAKALRSVFGHQIQDIVVNSTKAMTGHAIAASGALETIATSLSLATRTVHRCVNLENPDPECDLNFARQNELVAPLAALTSSFGFGGHNASLLLRAS